MVSIFPTIQFSIVSIPSKDSVILNERSDGKWFVYLFVASSELKRSNNVCQRKNIKVFMAIDYIFGKYSLGIYRFVFANMSRRLSCECNI